MLLRLTQPSNALSPIEVTSLGRTTSSSNRQLLNELSLIEAIDGGNTSFPLIFEPANTPSAITSTVLGISNAPSLAIGYA